jgi:hypothetical protein
MQRGAAETIHYTDSGSATQTEIRRLDHLNWDQGQSLAAMESTTGLGTPNDYTQESDGSFTATYKIEGLQPVDSAGVIPAHGTVQVDYTWDSARGWVTEGKPTVWTAGTAGFAEGAN